MLVEREIEFHYELRFAGNNGGHRLPDFTFIDAAGEKIIWEHLACSINRLTAKIGSGNWRFTDQTVSFWVKIFLQLPIAPPEH